jgi:dolichol-phosphate mannosyltransferase
LRGDAALASGWASTIAVVTLLAGANLLTTGIVGLYVGRIHAEVKRRPLYMVARSVGFEREPLVVPSASEQEQARARRGLAR